MEMKTFKKTRALLLFILCGLALMTAMSKNMTEKFKDYIPTISSRASNEDQETMFRESFDVSKKSELPIGSDNVTENEKYLIYRCDEDFNHLFCGGLADRLKGMMTGYMIANLTGRTFKAEMPMALCDFHKFLVPNQVDWYLPKPFHERIVTGPDVTIFDRTNNLSFIDGIHDDYFPTMPWGKFKYVYFKYNEERTHGFQISPLYRKQLSWMTNLTYAQMNDALYRRLFKPSPYMQDKLKSFFQTHLQPNNKLVCAHVRVGRNPTMPLAYPTRLSYKYLPNAWRFLKTFAEQSDTKIFFMSDSDQIISQVKKMSFGDKVFVSPGQTVHIDRSPGMPANVKCEGLEKIIFELIVLMHCDVLMISRSSISRLAAFVRGSDKGLYCFAPSGDVEPCKRSEILQKFNVHY